MATKPKNTAYKQSSAVTNLQKQLAAQEKAKPADWNGGTYQDAVQGAMDKILNRDKFSYDLNGDALYQQYKDQYSVLGKQAMMDTMGQAAALTGGYGNSYASTAGNQAYQSYLQQLNDIVPDLYGMALNQYNQEGQDLFNQYGMLSDQYNKEYGEYRDQVGDWQTQLGYLADRFADERNFDYGKYSDNRDYQWQRYETDLSNEWKKKEFDEAVRQFNASLKKNSSSVSNKRYSDGNPNPQKEDEIPDDAKITNRNGKGWIAINGARYTYAEVDAYVKEGKIKQTYDSKKNTVTYSWA